jgi:hypothetical protein
MAVSGRCSGGRGVCEPMATLGCDWHAVNDTPLAYGQLLVDDPERIGPIQAIGMDQTLFNREYRTQQWTTTFDSPLKSEGPVKRRQWARTRGSSEGAQPCFSSQLSVALPEHRAQEGGHGGVRVLAMTGRPPSKRTLRSVAQVTACGSNARHVQDHGDDVEVCGARRGCDVRVRLRRRRLVMPMAAHRRPQRLRRTLSGRADGQWLHRPSCAQRHASLGPVVDLERCTLIDRLLVPLGRGRRRKQPHRRVDGRAALVKLLDYPLRLLISSDSCGTTANKSPTTP